MSIGRSSTASGALILSGSIGKGHDSVADACRVALEGGGIDVGTLDCMKLLGGAGSRAGTALFRRMLAVPAFYDAFHFGHLRSGTWLPRALERAALRQLVAPLRPEVDRAGGKPLVVSVFPTGVSAAAALKAEVPELTSVAVCTDACAHKMWVAEGTDLYVVCSGLAERSVRRYAPRAKVAVVPPPVRPQFYEAPDRREARMALGIPGAAECVLIMAGGWGLGPLAATAESLARSGYHVLAVAGLNGRLYEDLQGLARRGLSVQPFALTDRVPELMAAADLVVTSPGQTCHEARVVGRWLVVVDVVPGHGRENTLHELEQGAALASSADPASVTAAVQVMLEDRPARVRWPVSSAREWEQQLFGALALVGVGPASLSPAQAQAQAQVRRRREPSVI